MQISLKQSEIEAALKQYIVQQGINLAGKDVEIAFTAGRKETGLSADINIEDAAQTNVPVGTVSADAVTAAANLVESAKQKSAPVKRTTAAEAPVFTAGIATAPTTITNMGVSPVTAQAETLEDKAEAAPAAEAEVVKPASAPAPAVSLFS